MFEVLVLLAIAEVLTLHELCKLALGVTSPHQHPDPQGPRSTYPLLVLGVVIIALGIHLTSGDPNDPKRVIFIYFRGPR